MAFDVGLLPTATFWTDSIASDLPRSTCPTATDFSPLVVLLQSLASVYTAGSLRVPLARARAFRETLQNAAGIDLSLYQIDSVEIYIRIIRYAYSHSAWTTVQDEQIPVNFNQPTIYTRVWLESDEWLDILLSRGLIWQAMTFVKALSDVREVQKLAFFAARSRYFKSKEEIERAALDLDQARSLHKALEQRNPTLIHETRFHSELIFAEIELPTTVTEAWLRDVNDAASAAGRRGDITVSSLFYDKAITACTSNHHTAARRAALNESDRLLKLSCDFPGLLVNQNLVWGIDRNHRSGELMNWYQWFDSEVLGIRPFTPYFQPSTDENRSFDNPMALRHRATIESMLLHATGDFVGAGLLRAELAELNKDIPIRALSDLGQSQIDLEWADKSRSNVNDVMDVLLQRLINAAQRNAIGEEVLQVVLQTPGAESTSFIPLEDVTAERLVAICYGPPLYESQWQLRFTAIKTWLGADPNFPQQTANETLLMMLLQHRQNYMPVGLPTNNHTAVVQSRMHTIQRLLDYLATCNAEVKAMNYQLHLRNRQILIQCRLQLFWNDPTDTSDIWSALADCNELLAESNASAIPLEPRYLAMLHNTLGQLNMVLAHQRHLVVIGFEEYEAADKIYEALRSELSVIGNINAQLLKARWRDTVTDGRQNVADAIFRARLEWMVGNALGMQPKVQAAAMNLWNWVQRSKARALTDGIASVETVPLDITSTVRESSNHQEMFERWTDMTRRAAELRAATPNAPELYHLKNSLDQLEHQMQQIPALDSVLAFRYGRAVTLQQMRQCLAGLPESVRSKIVLIDWHFILGQIIVLAVRHDGPVQVKALPPQPNLENLATQWVQKYLVDKLTPGSAFRELQGLNGLIAPITELSKPGDILVFCATGILNRIPMHAIQVPKASSVSGQAGSGDKELLLQRNLVVYIHSMSLFRFCVYSRTEDQVEQASKVALFSTLNSGRRASDMLARFFNTRSWQGEIVDRTLFCEKSESATFVNFFGHIHPPPVGPSPQAPILAPEPYLRMLNSHLMFGIEDETEGCTGNMEGEPQHDNESMITATGIWRDVRLGNGAHVNIIACGSGVSSASASEDFFGPVPSFFFAGARSLIVTSWPVAGYHAATWTQHFVEAWSNDIPPVSVDRSGSSDQQARRGWHLADYYRQSVLQLYEQLGEQQFFEWAGYQFYGYARLM
ncbi:hypothetical protein PV08_05121 [Exophiala spinifera]|uniref:CHAT domain-containing protein n=1 Tax=Exophiala spinifera TaxID=91928 RepID=A0A0D1YRR3_9EURO|nr:uncharacterized protein PV08_05121 [Exophiala spinifera]KIW17926.1 hypothetical protein PV08_05121 [Exophiala spinifera]